MVLIGLLALALACLVVGLILANPVFLLASLVASAVAGYLLWRQREQVAARTGVHKDQAAPKTSAPAKPAAVTGTASAASDAAPPDKAGAKADAAVDKQQVWVVDTMPQFHAKDCAAILNLESEPISLAQAVSDGFTECTVCKPSPSAGQGAQVWVVDGRPDYHAEDCRSLKIAASQQSKDPEQIPRAQAVDDGFSACPDCRPDGAAAADSPPAPAESSATAATGPAADDAPETAAAPADGATSVWVVDGRPRYHLADCMIIKDQQAEEIPLDQATEDGFMACTMCEPSTTRV